MLGEVSLVVEANRRAVRGMLLQLRDGRISFFRVLSHGRILAKSQITCQRPMPLPPGNAPPRTLEKPESTLPKYSTFPGRILPWLMYCP